MLARSSGSRLVGSCLVAACCLLVAPHSVSGQENRRSGEPSPPAVDWLRGPATAELGSSIAKIEVPEGYVFTGPEGTRKLMERMGNVPEGELGFLTPVNRSHSWFLLFSFHDVGYVKDDDQDKIDAKALLEAIRNGTEEANKERARTGVAAIHVVGWVDEPHYDPQSHNLVWSIEGKTDGGDRVLNYDVRLLGRKGYMSVVLVGNPGEVEAAKPEVAKLLGGFGYQQGNRYAEFLQGDKVAKYGLTALIAGGVGAAAAKLGLFAQLGKLLARGAKLIAVGIAALVAAIRKMLGLRPKKEPAGAAPPTA